MPGAALRDRYRPSPSFPGPACITRLALLLTLIAGASSAAQPRHLLGFVGRLCHAETHCFQLLVKPEFRHDLGARIKVRFDGKTLIFDPENYALTLTQQNIVPGAHLRLLIEAQTDDNTGAYRASHIWIGD